MTCEKCGHEMQVSDWPWCPHQRSLTGTTGAIDDTFVGGRVYENLGHEPVYIESRSHLKRELAARGLQEFVRHVPVPGSDKSAHTTSWTSVDLEAGKALAERQAHTRYIDSRERPDPAIIAVIKDVHEQLSARGSSK
jgi:hypothetical protein